jgi:phosphosulfolactate synthase (CoM biosynthesis protein A)
MASQGDLLQHLSLVTQHSDVRHRIITTIGQQDNDVDQHSHTADLLAAVSRAVRRGKGARETEAVNFDTRRVLQGEGDEQSQYKR